MDIKKTKSIKDLYSSIISSEKLIRNYSKNLSRYSDGDKEKILDVVRTEQEKIKKQVITFLSENGWPTEAEIGAENSFKLFKIIESLDLETQELAHKKIKEIKDKSKSEKIYFATLADSVSVQKTNKQQFGTQYRESRKGNKVLYPILNESTVDTDRAEIGLPTLEKQLKVDKAKKYEEYTDKDEKYLDFVNVVIQRLDNIENLNQEIPDVYALSSEIKDILQNQDIQDSKVYNDLSVKTDDFLYAINTNNEKISSLEKQYVESTPEVDAPILEKKSISENIGKIYETGTKPIRGIGKASGWLSDKIDYTTEDSLLSRGAKNTSSVLLDFLGGGQLDEVFNLSENIGKAVTLPVNAIKGATKGLLNAVSLFEKAPETLPQFAKGGIYTEKEGTIVAHGPEAIVPLPDGKSIPVKVIEEKKRKPDLTKVKVALEVDPLPIEKDKEDTDKLEAEKDLSSSVKKFVAYSERLEKKGKTLPEKIEEAGETLSEFPDVGEGLIKSLEKLNKTIKEKKFGGETDSAAGPSRGSAFGALFKTFVLPGILESMLSAESSKAFNRTFFMSTGEVTNDILTDIYKEILDWKGKSLKETDPFSDIGSYFGKAFKSFKDFKTGKKEKGSLKNIQENVKSEKPLLKGKKKKRLEELSSKFRQPVVSIKENKDSEEYKKLQEKYINRNKKKADKRSFVERKKELEKSISEFDKPKEVKEEIKKPLVNVEGIEVSNKILGVNQEQLLALTSIKESLKAQETSEDGGLYKEVSLIRSILENSNVSTGVKEKVFASVPNKVSEKVDKLQEAIQRSKELYEKTDITSINDIVRNSVKEVSDKISDKVTNAVSNKEEFVEKNRIFVKESFDKLVNNFEATIAPVKETVLAKKEESVLLKDGFNRIGGILDKVSERLSNTAKPSKKEVKDRITNAINSGIEKIKSPENVEKGKELQNKLIEKTNSFVASSLDKINKVTEKVKEKEGVFKEFKETVLGKIETVKENITKDKEQFLEKAKESFKESSATIEEKTVKSKEELKEFAKQKLSESASFLTRIKETAKEKVTPVIKLIQEKKLSPLVEGNNIVLNQDSNVLGDIYKEVVLIRKMLEKGVPSTSKENKPSLKERGSKLLSTSIEKTKNLASNLGSSIMSLLKNFKGLSSIILGTTKLFAFTGKLAGKSLLLLRKPVFAAVKVFGSLIKSVLKLTAKTFPTFFKAATFVTGKLFNLGRDITSRGLKLISGIAGIGGKIVGRGEKNKILPSLSKQQTTPATEEKKSLFSRLREKVKLPTLPKKEERGSLFSKFKEKIKLPSLSSSKKEKAKNVKEEGKNVLDFAISKGQGLLKGLEGKLTSVLGKDIVGNLKSFLPFGLGDSEKDKDEIRNDLLEEIRENVLAIKDKLLERKDADIDANRLQERKEKVYVSIEKLPVLLLDTNKILDRIPTLLETINKSILQGQETSMLDMLAGADGLGDIASLAGKGGAAAKGAQAVSKAAKGVSVVGAEAKAASTVAKIGTEVKAAGKLGSIASKGAKLGEFLGGKSGALIKGASTVLGGGSIASVLPEGSLAAKALNAVKGNEKVASFFSKFSKAGGEAGAAAKGAGAIAGAGKGAKALKMLGKLGPAAGLLGGALAAKDSGASIGQRFGKGDYLGGALETGSFLTKMTGTGALLSLFGIDADASIKKRNEQYDVVKDQEEFQKTAGIQAKIKQKQAILAKMRAEKENKVAVENIKEPVLGSLVSGNVELSKDKIGEWKLDKDFPIFFAGKDQGSVSGAVVVSEKTVPDLLKQVVESKQQQTVAMQQTAMASQAMLGVQKQQASSAAKQAPAQQKGQGAALRDNPAEKDPLLAIISADVFN